MRSERFERTGHKGKNTKVTEDMAIGVRRTPDFARKDVSSVIALSHIDFNDLRQFENLEAVPHTVETDAEILSWICAVTAESPTARALLREAQAKGWNIRLEDLGNAGFGIDDDAKCLILDHYGYITGALGKSAHFRNALIVNFIKALRTVSQEARLTTLEETLKPEALLMLERVRAADVETVAILVGWELRGSGHGDVWRYILGSETGDMAMIFTRALEKDPASYYSAALLARTFDQWYGDESRLASCDHTALEAMDLMMTMAEKPFAFGTASFSPSLVESVALLPDGRGYLAGKGTNIVKDPYFVGVDDPINQSHLFHIVYDMQVVMMAGVPFRDSKLARMIFPDGGISLLS